MNGSHWWDRGNNSNSPPWLFFNLLLTLDPHWAKTERNVWIISSRFLSRSLSLTHRHIFPLFIVLPLLNNTLQMVSFSSLLLLRNKSLIALVNDLGYKRVVTTLAAITITANLHFPIIRKKPLDRKLDERRRSWDHLNMEAVHTLHHISLVFSLSVYLSVSSWNTLCCKKYMWQIKAFSQCFFFFFMLHTCFFITQGLSVVCDTLVLEVSCLVSLYTLLPVCNDNNSSLDLKSSSSGSWSGSGSLSGPLQCQES